MAAKDEDSAAEDMHRAGGESDDAERRRRPAPKKARAERVSAPQALRKAAEQLAMMLGTPPESVSSLRPTENGWEADVEVVEVERVPETTSVMATYRVVLTPDGELMAYERRRRYARGQLDSRD